MVREEEAKDETEGARELNGFRRWPSIAGALLLGECC